MSNSFFDIITALIWGYNYNKGEEMTKKARFRDIYFLILSLIYSNIIHQIKNDTIANVFKLF